MHKKWECLERAGRCLREKEASRRAWKIRGKTSRRGRLRCLINSRACLTLLAELRKMLGAFENTEAHFILDPPLIDYGHRSRCIRASRVVMEPLHTCVSVVRNGSITKGSPSLCQVLAMDQLHKLDTSMANLLLCSGTIKNKTLGTKKVQPPYAEAETLAPQYYGQYRDLPCFFPPRRLWSRNPVTEFIDNQMGQPPSAEGETWRRI